MLAILGPGNKYLIDNLICPKLWSYLMANSRDLRLQRLGEGKDRGKVRNGVHIALITNDAATRKQLIPILIDFLSSQK